MVRNRFSFKFMLTVVFKTAWNYIVAKLITDLKWEHFMNHFHCLFIYLIAVVRDIRWSVITVQIILCGEQDITLQDMKQILEWNFSSGIFKLRIMWMDQVEYNSNLVCLNQRITEKFLFFWSLCFECLKTQPSIKKLTRNTGVLTY